MVDLIEEYVALMQQDHNNLLNTSLVSTPEVMENCIKLIASTPTESEGFTMIIKGFANSLFAIFSSSFPIYNQVYAIIAIAG